MKPNPPYYIATRGGFLIIEEDAEDGRVREYMTSDVRLATPFDTFSQADAAAKRVVDRIYPTDLAYFAIFTVARG